jgi:hypothetical protein
MMLARLLYRPKCVSATISLESSSVRRHRIHVADLFPQCGKLASAFSSECIGTITLQFRNRGVCFAGKKSYVRATFRLPPLSSFRAASSASVRDLNASAPSALTPVLYAARGLIALVCSFSAASSASVQT